MSSSSFAFTAKDKASAIARVQTQQAPEQLLDLIQAGIMNMTGDPIVSVNAVWALCDGEGSQVTSLALTVSPVA